MWLREQKPIRFYPAEEKEVKIANKESNGMLLWADQILCATNKQRIELNNRVRTLLGKGDKPEVGDKIICLHNQWGFTSLHDNALTNGCIGTITHCFEDYMVVPSYITSEPIPILCTTIETDDGDIFENIPIDYTYILTGQKFLTPEQEYKMRQDELAPDPPFEFTYGYAITCHKAQGSEWEKVLVFEEFFPKEQEEHFRWLYSAITRAAKKCVIIKK